MNDFRLTPVPDIDWAVRQVLRPVSGATAAPGAVRAFRHYLDTTGSQASATAIETDDGQTVLLLTRLPGRVGMVLLSVPSASVLASAEATGVALRAALAECMPGLVYLQALIDPIDAARRALLHRAGFAKLTTLVYFERGVTFPWVDEPDEALTWLDWSDDAADRFAAAIAASYEGSEDCPELTGMRTMDDVLAAHRAAGVFHHGFWQIVMRDGVDAGVLLLAEVPQTRGIEIVYLGVSPLARKMGVGRALMQRAFSIARRHRARTMTVVVDSRNAAARRLYESLAFHEVAQREAHWMRRDTTAASEIG
ncbi:MAG: GNAT family N-acetyltransferase [Phycisphaerae bacterium]